MQWKFDSRLIRLVRQVPVVNPYSAGELAALVAVAVAGAALCWRIATPVGVFGDWRTGATVLGDPAADAGLLARFDPFFRTAPSAGGATVTALQIKLFGTSMNSASGNGSAIIEIPEQGQQSFATGAEIMPGVLLKSVAFDHVTITRGSVDEVLYLDQSGGGGAGGPAPVAAATGIPGGVSLDALAADISVTERIERGAVTGLVVAASGDGSALRMAGLKPGDILTQVNGQYVRSTEDILEQIRKRPADGSTTFTVERGGKIETVRARLGL